MDSISHYNMTLTSAPSPVEALKLYRADFVRNTAINDIRPFIFPYHLYGFMLLGLYLLIPHTKRPWLYAARWPLQVLIWMMHFSTLLDSRNMDPIMGFGAGLLGAYGMITTSTWLWWNSPQFDAKRIQRRKIKMGEKSDGVPEAVRGVSSGVDRSVLDEGMQLKIVKDTQEETSQSQDAYEYYWQSFPEDDFWERLDWVTSLVLSRRGTRWNWRIPTLPKLPPSVSRSLEADNASNKDSEATQSSAKRTVDPRVQTSFTGIHTYSTADEYFRQQLPRLLVCLTLVSASLIAMRFDPYFSFGPNDYALPAHLKLLHPAVITLLRQLHAFFILVPALSTFTPVAIAALPLALSKISPVVANSIYGQPWLYPTAFGSPYNIVNKGLNGLWGSFWHQEFRFLFSAPVVWLVRVTGMNPKSISVKLSGLAAAFTISGLLHFGMSTSAIRKQSGWRSFNFFIMQGVGILLQMTVCAIFKGVIRRLPMWARKMGNVVFVAFWLWLTANLLLDDFARVGIWLEILGRKNFEGTMIGLHTGRHWWEYGVAVGGLNNI